jgi:hypothetical protein
MSLFVANIIPPLRTMRTNKTGKAYPVLLVAKSFILRAILISRKIGKEDGRMVGGSYSENSS